MKRKVYESDYDRRIDRRIGVIAFPIVNGAVWLLQAWLLRPTTAGVNLSTNANSGLLIAIQLIPWVVNGVVLALTLIFRPEIAIGYIGFFGGILLLGSMLAAVVIISCVVSIPVILIWNEFGLIVWIILMILGVLFFGIKLVAAMLHQL